jgi:hypothetical protein
VGGADDDGGGREVKVAAGRASKRLGAQSAPTARRCARSLETMEAGRGGEKGWGERLGGRGWIERAEHAEQPPWSAALLASGPSRWLAHVTCLPPGGGTRWARTGHSLGIPSLTALDRHTTTTPHAASTATATATQPPPPPPSTMQPAPGRRALSGLASRLHPQLPLSKRQSQNLLTLLTTSFRDHLDREHPVSAPDRSSNSNNTTKHGLTSPPTHARRNSTPARAESSQFAASSHIESILTNPLFATRPRRRSATSSDAREVLRDPLSWFNDQIALGTANVEKALTSLDMVNRATAQTQADKSQKAQDETKLASRIAEWLRFSGQDASKEFVDQDHSPLVKRLVPLLMGEDNTAPMWRWLKTTPAQRIVETGLDPKRVLAFRTQVLKLMVTSKLASEPTIDAALDIFLHAFHHLGILEHKVPSKIFQPVGASVVKHILANPTAGVSVDRYQSFLASSNIWPGTFSTAIQSLLWLNHPSKPSAGPGLAYIQDPNGAAAHVQGATMTRRRLIVQLCLGVANQLIAEDNLREAQIAISFTQDNFPDLVLSKHSSTDRHETDRIAKAKERGNLQMLDRLSLG